MILEQNKKIIEPYDDDLIIANLKTENLELKIN